MTAKTFGAGGSVGLAMLPTGDIQLTISETDAVTSESLVIALHPAVLSAALIKILGGGSFATSAVNFAMAELPNVIAAIP